MKAENRITLGNFLIYNPQYGVKEGRVCELVLDFLILFFNISFEFLLKEAERVFYYYPPDERIEKQVRISGFCDGMVKFTQ